MVNTAVSAGITHVFATPHHLNGQYENSKDDILVCVLETNKYLQQENIPLTIHPGQELRIHRELFNTLAMDEVLTLDNKGKYLLLELPSGEVPAYTKEVVYELLLKGITPIIVHPERNKGFINVSTRGFFLKAANEMITKTYGNHHTNYFKENSEILLSGHSLHIEHPIPIRKKILGVF